MARVEDLKGKGSENNLGRVIMFGLEGIPEVQPNDDIATLIFEAIGGKNFVEEGDIFAIASKIVAKAENQFVDLSTISPSDEAYKLSRQLGERKTPQVCQVILNESIRHEIRGSVVIAITKHGFELTSAGVDRVDENTVIILPSDPDASAKTIMARLIDLTGKKVAIVITDSEGRPFIAGAGQRGIGVAGIDPLRVREVAIWGGGTKKTEEILVDYLAGAAGIIMGQRGNNIPVVVIRGVNYSHNPDASVASIIY